MKKLVFIIALAVFMLFSLHGQESSADLLESQASNLLRMASNEIFLAKVAEQKASFAGNVEEQQELRKQARQNRTHAENYLEEARRKLQQAIAKRQEFVATVERQLQEKMTSLRIGSWNIQNFGESKMAKKISHQGRETAIPEVVARILLAEEFAAVAIQEVEGDNLEPLEAVVAAMNRQSETYRLTYPEKLGTSSNRAEYLPILYNNKLLKLKTQGMVKSVDMQRPPHYAYFSVRPEKFAPPSAEKKYFSFVLVSVHLSPKLPSSQDAPRRKDLQQIPRLIRQLRKKFGKNQDIIIAGDFNCDPNGTSRSIDNKLWKKLTDKGIKLHPFTDAKGNPVTSSMVQGNRFNDNMIWMDSTEEDWHQERRVYNIANHYFGRSVEVAKDISDHLPIWSTFHPNRDTD